MRHGTLSLLLALLTTGCCNPPLVATVDVPTMPQQADSWCWAASAQMTMKYFNHDVAQCTQANNRFGMGSCCTSNLGSCDNGGWPEYQKYNFTFAKTSQAPLSWEDVQSQIYCKKKPFAFSWAWTGGGGHMMVVKGYLVVNNVKYVDVNDPEPFTDLNTAFGGTETVMTYARYVSDTDHTHWDDFYDLTYTGP
jgi:Papain-like cysteine protease AvrRpt2